MKVTTDGCLFGAITTKEISAFGNCKVLDIGTGTGLLSLMIAQENATAKIDAIEIEEAATGQAKENVLQSPWSSQIEVLQGDILDYQGTELYDVIISNPPFYEKQLSSPKAEKQLAHHSSQLTLQELFQQVKKLVKQNGKFYLLLPFYRKEEAEAIANELGLFPQKIWLIKQTINHSFFRVVFCFGLENVTSESIEIAIRNEQNEYMASFTKLLQLFYLKL